jgi:hypothetical protein
MGTRALIGYLDTDGDLKLTSTYNHYDGYPQNLGKGLESFYNSDAKAEEVANVGYISFLDGETGEIESKNQQMPDVTKLTDNFNEAMMEIAGEIDGMSADYGYIWDNENQEWITVKNEGIGSMAKNLALDLSHLKGKFEMSPEQTMEVNEAKGSITGPEWNQMSKEDKTELLKKHFPKLSLKFADWKWNDLTPMIKNKLTGKVVNEGYYGTTNVENHIQAIGYDSFEDFFNDNPGGEEALISWIESIPEFRKMLMQQGMMEAKKDKVELDEYFINKMKFRAGIIK